MDNNKQKDKKVLEIAKLKKDLEDYKNCYLRALADYRNLEKRIIEEKEQLIFQAKKNLFLKLLPVLDNIEKAEIFIKDEGLKMIKNSFFQLLKSEGIEEIEVLGKEFDPYLAEAVEVVEGERDNVVVEVVRKGYKINNKILRVAQVKVSKSKRNIKKEAK